MPEKPLIPPAPAADKKKTAEADDAGSAAKSKPLEGVTGIDDKVFLECEMLAYAAVGEIAVRIATETSTAHRLAANEPAEPAPAAPLATVILIDETLVSAFQLHAALQLQLALFERSFEGVAPAPAPAPAARNLRIVAAAGMAIGTVTGAVQGALDLLGLFRQDTQFSGRTVAIKETALYLEIAHALRHRHFEVIYPRLLAYQANEQTQLSQTALTQLFDSVFKARADAARRLRPVLALVAGIEQQILDRERQMASADKDAQKALTAEIQDFKAQLATARQNLDPDLVLFENTDTHWNDLQKGLSTPDDKSGQVPMQLLSRAAEAMARFADADGAYFLYAEAVVAGGTMRIKRNLWRTLFNGDALEFSGGAIVSYALFDGRATILAARTHREMTTFQGFPEQAPVWTGFNTA